MDIPDFVGSLLLSLAETVFMVTKQLRINRALQALNATHLTIRHGHNSCATQSCLANAAESATTRPRNLMSCSGRSAQILHATNPLILKHYAK